MCEEINLDIQIKQLKKVKTVSHAVELLFNLSNEFELTDISEMVEFFNDKPEIKAIFQAYQNSLNNEN